MSKFNVQQGTRQEINNIGPNRNYVRFLTTASYVIHLHFHVHLTAMCALQRFSAIKNDNFQNTTIDVQKPHQTEVFRIATALQAQHRTAPALTTQRSMRQTLRCSDIIWAARELLVGRHRRQTRTATNSVLRIAKRCSL